MESQLIGDILRDEAENRSHRGLPSDNHNSHHTDPLMEARRQLQSINRPTSAPPIMPETGLNYEGFVFTDNKESMSQEEYQRSNPQYYAYYYSQRALNPRLPPPLLHSPFSFSDLNFLRTWCFFLFFFFLLIIFLLKENNKELAHQRHK